MCGAATRVERRATPSVTQAEAQGEMQSHGSYCSTYKATAAIRILRPADISDISDTIPIFEIFSGTDTIPIRYRIFSAETDTIFRYIGRSAIAK